MEATIAELVSAYWNRERFAQARTPGADDPTKRKEKTMACPTCDHTMSCLGETVEGLSRKAIWWCQRCGSIRIDGFGSFDEAPKLVERCREFEKGREMRDDDNVFSKWHMLGIAESINLPEQRPTEAAQEEPTNAT